jgi:hypothetical protein
MQVVNDFVQMDDVRVVKSSHGFNLILHHDRSRVVFFIEIALINDFQRKNLIALTDLENLSEGAFTYLIYNEVIINLLKLFLGFLFGF